MPDLMPTEGMREEAQRYRDWKAEGRRGGTEVAERRAGQILSGEPLSEPTVLQMAAWFARHEVDKQGEGFSPGEDGYPSPGRVAWAAWGGDPGQRWANEKADSIKADRGIARMEDQEARPYPNEHAARLVDPEGFDRFRRQNDAGGEGVDFIYGIKGDDPVVLQAIRFDADRFTPAEARQWLEEHDHTAILFEEATGERELSAELEPTGRQLLSDELQRCFGSGVMRRELDVAMAPELTEDGVRFTFSSESPVARWYGEEVLSHAPGAADLSRLNNGAVHLWNHDRDVVLGVVTGAEIGADRRGVVTTRWSPNTLERGSEEWKRRQDVESAITSKVSFAYEVRDAMDMGDGKILVTKWAPLEVSTVSIPADDTVGHDRQQREYRAPDDSAGNDHPPAGPDPADSPPEPQQMEPLIMDEQVSAPPETMTVETQQDARSAAEVERERIKSIGAMCRQHGMPEGMAEDLVDAGVSVDQAREQVLSKIGKRSRELQPGGLHVEADALIGMDKRDLSRYSMMKLLRHLADPTNQALRDAAGFELDCHRAAELKADRAANGAWIPFDVVVAKRDQTVGNFGKGGALVGTELLAGSFIDLLINQSALLQSGITTLSGLTGAVDIPRKTAASQHYWVGEDVDVSPSDVTFGLISSTPKTIGVRVPVSRRSLIQTTPDIDTLVRQDMAERMALGVDSSGLYGTGSSGQPLGLRNVTGIGSVTLGGGASQVYPSNLGSGTHDSGDWNDYIDLRAACTAANVNVGSARYIMNAITEAGGMKTLRASAAGSDYIVSDAGTIGRHPVLVSNQVQTNDVFYGVFSDLVLATWSGLDIVVDPYTQSAKGQVIYTVMQDLDWVCRRAASFALGT